MVYSMCIQLFACSCSGSGSGSGSGAMHGYEYDAGWVSKLDGDGSDACCAVLSDARGEAQCTVYLAAPGAWSTVCAYVGVISDAAP
jgi:hypothetical protein